MTGGKLGGAVNLRSLGAQVCNSACTFWHIDFRVDVIRRKMLQSVVEIIEPTKSKLGKHIFKCNSDCFNLLSPRDEITTCAVL